MTDGCEKTASFKMISGKFQHGWIGPHSKWGKASRAVDQIKLDRKGFFDGKVSCYRFPTGIPINSASLGANEKNAGPFLLQAEIRVKSFKYVKIIRYQYGYGSSF
jgi:hypothetical protein